MATQAYSIRKFVGFLNNNEEQGGYWLPNIQRPFVWKETQIERLYDSILREYPIGTFLVWKTVSMIKRRKFIDIYRDGIKLTDYYVPQDNNQKMMILDGQQRIQSLFVGLKGSYNSMELYFNILSGDLKAPEEIKFEFKFLTNDKVKFPFVKFKDLVFTDKRKREIQNEITIGIDNLTTDDRNKIEDNLEIIREVFCTQENIIYQLVDSVDRPSVYNEDDVVEIFIRANSGGTLLSKSDLLFTLLTSSWDESEIEIDSLLEDLNKTGYKFDRDFILKTCLVLLDQGAKYEIAKFRDTTIKDAIETNWKHISDSIRYVKDFIYGNTFLKTDKNLPSYISLIPLIYFKYHYENKWLKNNDYAEFLVKVNLTGVFGGVSDSFTDGLITTIKKSSDFIKTEIYGFIRESGKSMEISENILLKMHYSLKEVHLLFNMWYGFNYQPSLKDNLPQIDHIFPQSELKKIKVLNPETKRVSLMKYQWWERDQLPNLMLLTAAENGAGGKTDILPDVFFADKSKAYLDLHLIPDNPELWKLENYEKFIEARKALIIEKFDYLIQKK